MRRVFGCTTWHWDGMNFFDYHENRKAFIRKMRWLARKFKAAGY